MAADQRRILCVGLSCTDIINVAASYPKEDTDQRVLEQRWQRGGNASNNCTVLSYLGDNCELLCTIALDEQTTFMKSSLEASGINIEHCSYHEGCSTPTSIVIINNQTGTRTILFAAKNLPEVSLEDFEKIPLAENRYKWIHLEGRPGCNRVKEMLEVIAAHNAALTDPALRITTSVELEKTRDELICLEDKADFLFISKEHAQFRGCEDMQSTVKYFSKRCRPNTWEAMWEASTNQLFIFDAGFLHSGKPTPLRSLTDAISSATVICAWGELGAVALDTATGVLHASPAFPPARVTDTLAAGDTFTAATIHALARGETVQSAITFGCRVAGAKVGMKGLSGIKDWHQDFIREST